MAELFVCVLALPLMVMLWWGLRHLPREEWQILAAVPQRKETSSLWQGVNFTYYGAFLAGSLVLAVGIAYLLLATVALSDLEIVAMAVPLLLCGGGCSVLVAILVERQRHTFTVAGAIFVGLLLAPWLILLLQKFGVVRPIPVITVLAALGAAYALGEGVGRLACVSFGCCYGKPLSSLPQWARQLLWRWAMVFNGDLKKAAYEGDLEGQPLVPVQGMTALLFVTTGLGSTLLFLKGHDTMAFLIVVSVTQSWRVIAEFLRADYRGGQYSRLSGYQIMALFAIPYGVLLAWIWGDAPPPQVDLTHGLRALWNPTVLLLLQMLGLAAFLFYGTSSVTESRIMLCLKRRNSGQDE